MQIEVVRSLSSLVVAVFVGLWIPPMAHGGPRVIILGFDGVDPRLVDSMFERDELPHLKKIAEDGVYSRLQTTVPPLSPVAWSSFTTCTKPGTHGVFDFLARNPLRYSPMPGDGAMEPPQFDKDGNVVQPPRYITLRKGAAFWVAADRQGKKCKVLHVPFAFPTDPLVNGLMLCGEGVPDIRGTQSTSYWMSDSFTPEQLREDVGGGIRMPLRFTNDETTVRISTYREPRPGRLPYVLVPVKMTVNRESHVVAMDFPSGPVAVAEGKWSDWIEWRFQATPKYTIRGLSRVYVIECGSKVRVYMSCIQMHPREPYVPFTTPTAYSAELADRYGLFKTIGWVHDTNAVRKDALPDDEFLKEARDQMEWERQLTLDEIERGEFDLLVSCTTATDRVSHLFWRYRDPKHPLYTEDGAKKYGRVVEDFYRQMDGFVGDVVGKLRPDDLLMILSDHGFESFRVGFNAPTWLIRNGYLTVEGQTDAATATKQHKSYLDGYDWSKTKAYSIGLGAIFLNLKGREAEGIVSVEEAPALLEEIKSKLLEVTYPETGEKIFNTIYTREEFKGQSSFIAPDLQFGYRPGFQTSKAGAKGEAPAELFSLNEDKWSGDHASSTASETPGVFFANRKLAGAADASIIDLGVTALSYLGAEVPAELQGRSLLE
ncbi:MAG: hypothetical protein AMXMBFR4_14120 [Candidatus Hydrogenedentota bacterium]